MKKETAVEWLFAHLLPFLSFSDVKEREHFRKCLEESKAMEKDQIIKAVILSHFEGARQSAKTSEEYIKYGEQYYNETYNTKQK